MKRRNYPKHLQLLFLSPMRLVMWTTAYTLILLHLNFITCAGSEPVIGCWPNNVIPFKISYGFSDNQLHIIHDAIGEFNRFTCIRWVEGEKVPYNATETEHVVFQRAKDIYFCLAQQHELARGGNVMTIQLGESCFNKKVLMHEMLHVLGFSHEHQRANRDCYVQINQHDADQQNLTSLFAKERHEQWLERFPYDKYSIMHYPRSSTMKGKDKRQYTEEPLGSPEGALSFFDLWKILYKFCSFPHYCDVFPEICVFIGEVEKNCTKPMP